MSTSRKDSDCVLVFLRSPDPGRVKTRLAQKIGEEAASDLYRCFVSDLLDMLAKTGFPVRLFFSPVDAATRIGAWLGRDYPMAPQIGEDLGQRMSNAFSTAFEKGALRALLVGTDVPDLPAERIASGFASLRSWPAVLTPTPDGGYCLIGFRADTFAGGVFSGQPWGSHQVLESTLAAFTRLQRPPRLLKSWPDIDTLEDLVAFRKRTKRRPASAPQTTGYLAARFPGGLPGDSRHRAGEFD